MMVEEPLVAPAQERTEKVEGVPRTANVNGLPVITVPVERASVIRKEVVDLRGDVTENPKFAPPFMRDIAGEPLPEGPYVGTEKSATAPIAEPAASFTVTTQEMTSPTRTYVVAAFVTPTHVREDDELGNETLKAKGLPVITDNDESFSVT